MEINFNVKVKAYNGEDLDDTINNVVCKCLYSANNDFSQQEKLMAYKILNRLLSYADNINITAEEATLIEKICEKNLTAGAYGQIYYLIEGDK